MKMLRRLAGRRPKPELAPEVLKVKADRDDALIVLETAIQEADRLMDKESRRKNGVIADYEAAEQNRLNR